MNTNELESLSLFDQMKHTIGYQVGASSIIKDEVLAELATLHDSIKAELDQVDADSEADSDYSVTYAERIEGEALGLGTALELVSKHRKNIENLFE